MRLIIKLSLLSLFNISIAKNVLVTGGTGFIGSHLTERLLDRGDVVIITDRVNRSEADSLKDKTLQRLKNHANRVNLKIYMVDVNEKKELEKIFVNEKIDVICHLAAKSNIQESCKNPDLYYKDVQSTLFLLQNARSHKVPHFVFASSSAVYGNSSEIPYVESMTADRQCNFYGTWKRTSELLSYTYHYLHGISCTCLRLFTVYGPRGVDRSPLIFLKAICSNTAIKLKNDGMIARDFVYIDDVIQGIIQSIDYPNGFLILNIGSGTSHTLNEVITLLEEITDRKAIIEKIKSEPGDPLITYADIELANKLINYKPTTSLYEGLKKTLDWFINEY